MLARGTRDSIRNDVFLKIHLHPLHIGGHPRTVDDNNLVSGDTVEVDLARPKFLRWMKLDLVECPSGFVAEIDITARRPPLGRNVVFHLPKEEKQAGFRHEMLEGLVRKFGQVVRPTQGIASRGPIQIGAEFP